MATDAVNPNALGAPASGFGQTVSFAFDANGQPPQMQPVTSRGPQIGAQNVSSRGRDSSTQIDTSSVTADPTAQVLMKVGGEILAKRLDESRTEQFVNGMQRAMGGEAIAEIKESVPWYAKIMGDTPVIEGARAYTAQDQVNKTINAQVTNIKSIEGMGPEDAAKHFNQVVKGALTGDSSTDVLVMKQLSEQLPTLMKAQAKAHYAFGQKNMAKAQMSSMASGAAALQQNGEMYAQDKITDKDMEIMSKAFVMSALPVAGQDEEGYQKTLATAISSFAQQGQFHAVEALRKSGVMQALNPEQAAALEKRIEAEGISNRNKYAGMYADAIGGIKSDARAPKEGQTATQLAKRVDDMNAAYTKLTGNKAGLFSSDEKADLIAGHYNAFKARVDQVERQTLAAAKVDAKAADKTKAAEDKTNFVNEEVAKGNWLHLAGVKGVTGDEINGAVYQQYNDLASKPQEQMNFLKEGYYAGGNTAVNPWVAADLQRPMKNVRQSWDSGNTAPPAGFFDAVNKYNSITQTAGSGAADAYFGEWAKPLSYATKMLESSGGQDGPTSAIVYAGAMSLGNSKGPKLPEKESKALTEKLVSAGRSWTPTWLGGNALRPDAVRQLQPHVEERAQAWMAAGHLDKESAYNKALTEVLGPQNDGGNSGGGTGEIIGGYFIERQPGSSTRRLSDLMSDTVLKGVGRAIPEELKGNFFKGFLEEQVKVPANASTVQIIRGADTTGEPAFSVVATDKDGLTTLHSFTSGSLQDYAGDKTKWARLGFNINRAMTPEEVAAGNAQYRADRETPAPARTLHFGPAITYKPAEGQPSPYASPEVWSAYRQKQATDKAAQRANQGVLDAKKVTSTK